MKTIERILRYRAINNLSQEEFAKRMEVSRCLVNLLENEKREPSKMFLAKMELLEKGE